MPDTLNTIATGGGGGLLGAILGFLGIKRSIDRVDKDLQAHKKIVVTKDAFAQFEKSQDIAHKDLKDANKEIDKKLDQIILHMPKRNGD